MKKKVLSGLICVATCVAIAGCGASAKEEKAETEKTEAAAPESEVVEAAAPESEAAPSTEADLPEETEQPSEEEYEPRMEDPVTRLYHELGYIVVDADPNKWDAFRLIDLDGDGLFELFATCFDGEREDPGIQPYMIVGHNDDGVVVNDELYDGAASAGGYRGTLYCLEGTGKLYESISYAPYGTPADRVYSLIDGKITETDIGEFVVDTDSNMGGDDWDPYEHGQWIWNGSAVFEEDYMNSLMEATGDMEGSALSEMEWEDSEGILEELQSLIDGNL